MRLTMSSTQEMRRGPLRNMLITTLGLMITLSSFGCDESNSRGAPHELDVGGESTREPTPVDLDVDPDADTNSDMYSDVDSGLPTSQPSLDMGFPVESTPSAWNAPITLSTDAVEQVLGIDALPSHDLVIAGRAEGSLIEGGHLGAADGFVALIRDAGELAWVKQLGSAGVDQLLDVVYHPEDMIFAGGFSTGDFEGVPNEQFMDGTLVALNVEGEIIWSKLLDLGIVNRLYPTPRGVVAVGAYDLGSGDTAAFVAEYDLNGARLWLATLNSPSYDAATSVTLVDETLYVSGFTSGSVIDQTSREDLNMFVAALSLTGEVRWVKEYGEVGDDSPVRIASTPDGLIVVGYTSGLLGEQQYGGNDVAVLKLDFNGEVVWIRQLGTMGSEGAYGLTITPEQTIIISGRIDGASWDESSSAPLSDQSDAFILTLSPTGVLIEVEQSNLPGRDEWVDLIWSSGALNLAGYSEGTTQMSDLDAVVIRRVLE